ncbi:aspartokinase [Vibrio zhanjiangensis]|uniref:Aspartokinase n=1 Tax=Vibrio zhanjiangensis TaxID=1046128 RepID=A0ABQ6F330_9VIBR|nr:aspartate kinase [Vibrio zhanjiangensis]GLT19928.1 aspartokinase [Vibrio zhanjiangensis]
MKHPLIVQKFGGTSVGSIENIHKVAEHIIKAKDDGNQVVVVVSAMSGETNRLMDLAKQIDSVPTARELDVLLSAGEQVSMALLAIALNKQGYPARSLTGAQANIVTDHQHNDATIIDIDTSAIEALLAQDLIVIVAGFQGVNESGDITTLGRGGSDTSAVTLAGKLQADECQIFTDVDGIYTCDPRVVPDAKKIDVIDFASMEEMASKGAKVLHLPSVQYAWQNNVPLRVLSTFSSSVGSLVKGSEPLQSICGLALQRDMRCLTVASDGYLSFERQSHMLGVQIWAVMESKGRVTIVVKDEVYAKLELTLGDKIGTSKKVSLLTLVGRHLAELTELTHVLLNDQGINAMHCDINPQSLTWILPPENIDKAANILHHAYFVSAQAINYQSKLAYSG